MSYYRELSLVAQTAYSELLDAALAQEMARTVANLNGSFATKSVKGRVYHYFQYRELDGKVKQLYLGPDSGRLSQLLQQSSPSPARALEPLARAAIELGCASVVPKQQRIVRRLSEYGFFRAGGVLIGTHAFLAFGNMLGVGWIEGARTLDVDFAHAGNNISIALPATVKVDVHEALESLEMGFLPIKAFDGKLAAGYLNPQRPDLRIDFVTTMSRQGDQPFSPAHMNVPFQPMKFMEFLLEDVAQAVLLSRAGAVLVNTPSPARYALHKLLVFAERKTAERAKAEKDIRQAAALIAWFSSESPGELSDAWANLRARGKGWTSRADKGLEALERLDRGLARTLRPDL